MPALARTLRPTAGTALAAGAALPRAALATGAPQRVLLQ